MMAERASMNKTDCPVEKITVSVRFIGTRLRQILTQVGETGRWKLYENFGMPGNDLANSLAISLAGWS